ncbi:hypothetical protein F5890DRAFT_1478027 [Lentinula detonsa]|uniref:Uncharacterized protein n=1 Tax=Lentinula detonsa TaxID=2804962 RepID=A0AA38PQV0_9AGAR|nr:hypothetical protein F5890DRAFT_1478027 [Lentinula detonsa]
MLYRALAHSFALFLCLALSNVKAVPLSLDNSGSSLVNRHSIQGLDNQPRGISFSKTSSSPPGAQLSTEPISLYFFTCEPVADLILQGKYLKDAYSPPFGKKRTLSMFPDQGISPFAPTTCKGKEFAVVEFKLNPAKGLTIKDKRYESRFKLSLSKPDVIISRDSKNKSVVIVKLVTNEAAQFPALTYVSYQMGETANEAWRKMKKQSGGTKVVID